MEPLTLLLLLLIGSGAGFLTRLFGPPGGLVMVPLLIAMYQSSGTSSLIATHLSLGTALLVYACVFGAGMFRKHRESPLQLSVPLMAGGMLGVIGGTLVAGSALGSTLQKIYAVIVFLGILQLLGDAKKARKELPAVRFRLFITGLAGGAVASWSGGGGEGLCQRTLYSYLGYSLNRSQVMAVAAMVGTVLVGAVGFAVIGRGAQLLPPGAVGFVGVLEAIPVVAGFLLSDRPAGRIPEAMKPWLRRVYVVILLVVAARMFFR